MYKNLLPGSEISKNKHIYLFRFAYSVLFLSLSAVCIGVALLTSVYVSFHTKEQGLKRQLETSKQVVGKYLSKDEQNLILDTNKKITAASGYFFDKSIAGIMSAIIKVKNEDVRLISMHFDSDSDLVHGTFKIEGIASTRRAAVSFRDGIKDAGIGSGVDLPISDLAPSKDLNFHITITGVSIPSNTE